MNAICVLPKDILTAALNEFMVSTVFDVTHCLTCVGEAQSTATVISQVNTIHQPQVKV